MREIKRIKFRVNDKEAKHGGEADKRKKIRGYSFQGLKCSKVQPIRQGLPELCGKKVNSGTRLKGGELLMEEGKSNLSY